MLHTLCNWHPFFSIYLGQIAVAASSQDALVPSHVLQLFLWDPKAFPGQVGEVTLPACWGSAMGSPPSWTGYHTRFWAGDIQIRQPKHLNWIFPMRGSFYIFWTFTLSLRVWMNTLQREIYFHGLHCINILTLSVSTQSLWWQVSVSK